MSENPVARMRSPALLAVGAASLEGWSPIYLGANLPVLEICRVALEHHARAIALSCTYMDDPNHLVADIRELQDLLPPECPIFIGGKGAKNSAEALEHVGAYFVSDLQQFRDALRQALTR